MWNVKKPRTVGLPNLIQKPLSSYDPSIASKTSPQGLAPQVSLRMKPVQLICAKVVSLLDVIYSLWATPTSYFCLFICRCFWPLLEHLTQESSDFCLCVNLCINTHTQRSSPLLSSDTTATFLTNHLFKSKYLNNFSHKSRCAKKRKHLELCLLNGCSKTLLPTRVTAPSFSLGWVQNKIPCFLCV